MNITIQYKVKDKHGGEAVKEDVIEVKKGNRFTVYDKYGRKMLEIREDGERVLYDKQGRFQCLCSN